jgi:hypothetical protein
MRKFLLLVFMSMYFGTFVEKAVTVKASTFVPM